MPIGITMQFHCPKCRWSSPLTQMSDVFVPGMLPSVCPKCGNTKLEYRPPRLLTLVLADMKKYIGIRVGKGR